MMRVNLDRQQVSRGSLVLVNRNHPVTRRLGKKSLGLVGQGIAMEAVAAAQLNKLLKDQTDIVCVSGFRSREEQERIYTDSLQENGEAFTRQYVAMPSHSEHECGLAIDLGENRQDIDFIRPAFPYEGKCQAFRDKLPDHGFIQRYEAGKEIVTGISHEPWHFRYVGLPHSLMIRDLGVSLEEYIRMLREKEAFTWNWQGKEINVRYVPVKEGGDTICHVPEDSAYQISGDNVGGFVVTWL